MESKLVDIADAFAKIAVGIVAVLGAIYLGLADRAKQCTGIVDNLYHIVTTHHYDPAAVDMIVGVSDIGNCNLIERGIPAALKAASQGTEVAAESANIKTTAQPTKPPDKDIPVASEASSNWVAIGFLDSSDVSFENSDGTRIALPLNAGTTIKAKVSVNVRPGPAAWATVNSVLKVGECFKVTATRVLSAGKAQQTWASGKPAACV